jgi:hypothetical protein
LRNHSRAGPLTLPCNLIHLAASISGARFAQKNELIFDLITVANFFFDKLF